MKKKLNKLNKKDYNFLLEYAENEICEWVNFINLLNENYEKGNKDTKAKSMDKSPKGKGLGREV